MPGEQDQHGSGVLDGKCFFKQLLLLDIEPPHLSGGGAHIIYKVVLYRLTVCEVHCDFKSNSQIFIGWFCPVHFIFLFLINANATLNVTHE